MLLIKCCMIKCLICAVINCHVMKCPYTVYLVAVVFCIVEQCYFWHTWSTVSVHYFFDLVILDSVLELLFNIMFVI